MIDFIIKCFVTGFFIVVSIIIFSLWLTFGTILLIVTLIRLITLYTIALLNSFISGTPLTYDYIKGINDFIDTYLNTYVKILSMPKLPWQPIKDEDSTLRSLLATELAEIKKSKIITAIVFISYIISFSFSLAYLTYNRDREIENEFIKQKQALLEKMKDLEFEKANIIRYMYLKRNFSIYFVSEALNISVDSTYKYLEKNKIQK